MAKKKPKKKKTPRPEPKAKEKTKCTGRVKRCRKCKYKYEAGDKSWECPQCGTDRHCKNDAIYPYKVCRMHGAGGGRPPIHGKFSIPAKHADRFNQIRQDPELMSLAYNTALSETRTDELLQQMHDNDTSAVHRDVMSALYDIELTTNRLASFLARKDIVGKIPKTGFASLFIGIIELRAAIEPAHIEAVLWRELNQQLELTRRLNDTERKWATAHDQMIPISIALEAVRTVMRDALEFIPAPTDRKKFATRIRGYLGE